MILSSGLLNSLLQLIIILPFLLLAKRQVQKGSWRIYGIFFILFMLWSVLTQGLAGVVIFDGQQWNWVGKFAGFLLCIFFIYRSKLLSKRETGWTVKMDGPSVKPVLIMLVVLLAIRAGIYVAFQNPILSFNKETVLFQGTLAAIGDELFFRGILLALLNRVFTAGEDFFGFPLSFGVLITSLLYGLTQGFYFQDGLHLQINLMRILLAFIVAIVAAMLKERSGSLLPAVVFHALWNLIGNH